MNRVIKFRAWSNKWRKMVYHGEDGYEIDVLAATIWRDVADDEACILMQFTGLLDKDGKDIYEGDILSRRGMEDGEVRYEKGVWVIFSETSSAIWKQELHNHYHHTEIIDNIYQKI